MNARITLSLVTGLLVLSARVASAELLTFTKLTGVTGGTPTATAVYRADLSTLSLAAISEITVTDISGGSGGFTGQLSGFDLDRIFLSTSSVATAPLAQALVGLPGFDFTPAGTLFSPGTQRAPVEAKLFGTGPAGNTVDNAVATLDALDGNSTIVIAAAFGFVSMGDGGVLTFKLTAPITTAGKFLYVGEVGDNGELLASISVNLPEPSSILLAIVGIVGLAACARRSRLRRAVAA
jgi:hypothetical protein